MVDVTFVEQVGDWEMLIIDGEVVSEGHYIDVGDVLRELQGERIGSVRTEWLGEDDLRDEYGSMAEANVDIREHGVDYVLAE